MSTAPTTTGGTIALDFDGVLHSYSKGWQDGSIYDPPVPGAFKAIKYLKSAGYRLVIFSVRPADQIRTWMEREDPEALAAISEIGDTKPSALLYIDDRGLRFTSWATALPEAMQILMTEHAKHG